MTTLCKGHKNRLILNMALPLHLVLLAPSPNLWEEYLREQEILYSIMNQLCDPSPRFYPSMNHLAFLGVKVCQLSPRISASGKGAQAGGLR